MSGMEIVGHVIQIGLLAVIGYTVGHFFSACWTDTKERD